MNIPVSVKVSFLLFLFFSLSVKHGLSMNLHEDLRDNTLRPVRRVYPPRQDIYDHFNFHDLNHYSQTDRLNNKSIADYFKSLGGVMGYFKMLHQLTANASGVDQGKAWALARVGATYDAKVQYWILSYAIRYIDDHFLTSRNKSFNPRFHQWVYIVRSFQGCVVNFDADLFIHRALESYLLSFDGLKHYEEGKLVLKEQGHNFSINPKETIRKIQSLKLESCKLVKDYFIQNANHFEFLYLYAGNQQIYDESCEKLNRLEECADNGVMLKLCIELLLMRRIKNSLHAIIQKLIEKQKGKSKCIEGTKIFLECYNSWKFNIPLEDENMKIGLGVLNKIGSKRSISLTPFCSFDGKSKDQRRKRSASLT